MNSESTRKNTLGRSKKAIDFVFEFLAIILGVLVAFWLSSWGDVRKEKKLEEFYLNELVKNLNLDQKQLKAVIENQANRAKILDGLLQIMPQTELKGKSQIDSTYTSARGNPTFFPATGAYKSMVSEGSLDLISNKELVTLLVELYEFYYVRSIYLGTVLDDEVERTTWETRKFYSLYDNEFNDLAAIKSHELRVIIGHRHAYIRLYLGHARETLEKVNSVKIALEKELNS